jgi:hypothetical protein
MPRKRTTDSVAKPKKTPAPQTKKLTTSEVTEVIPANKAPNVFALQPKPAERRLVSDNGIMRRYTMVVGPKRIVFDVTTRVIDLRIGRKPGTLIAFEKREQSASEPKEPA